MLSSRNNGMGSSFLVGVVQSNGTILSNFLILDGIGSSFLFQAGREGKGREGKKGRGCVPKTIRGVSYICPSISNTCTKVWSKINGQIVKFLSCLDIRRGWITRVKVTLCILVARNVSNAQRKENAAH